MGPQQKPGPEIGLMVSESLFGILTSAGTALIPYYLLVKPFSQSTVDPNTGQVVPPDPTIVNVLFILTFSAVPLAVSQTELALANGSRFYLSESWPPALAGLLAEAAVVGLKYLLQSSLQDAGEGLLLIGTIAFVPIAEMVAINIFKTPRYRFGYGPISGLLNYHPDHGLTAGVPMPLPILAQSSSGLGAGLSMNVLSGRF